MLARLVGCSLTLALAAAAWAVQDQSAPKLGSGAHTYRWVKGWGTLPDGAQLGNTHGCIVTDSKGRVYFNTDTAKSVVVFERDGTYVGAWGERFAGGLHGMALVKEKSGEFLYLTHTGQHKVFKTSLAGDVLWELGWPEASGAYANENEYHPTSIAVAPDGRFWVADGYGKSWVHAYDAERKYVRSFGGPGTEDGKMQTPHGIWYDARTDQPLLLVADRENNRLQWFDLEGKHVRTLAGDLRRPCHAHESGKDLVIADLAGRVTILDGENKVVCHLGDNPDPAKRAQNGVPREEWRDGEFISPHCARWDDAGNLYVLDWLSAGRITKLERLR